MDTKLVSLIVVLIIILVMQIGSKPKMDPKTGYLGRVLKYITDLRQLSLLKRRKNQIKLFLEDPDGGDPRRPEYERELKEVQKQIEFIKSNLDDIPFRWTMLVLVGLFWTVSSIVFGKQISDKIQNSWLSLIFAFAVFLVAIFGLMVTGPLFAGTLSTRLKIRKKEKEEAELNIQIKELEENMEDYGESEESNRIVGKLLFSRGVLLNDIEQLKEELARKVEKFERM